MEFEKVFTQTHNKVYNDKREIHHPILNIDEKPIHSAPLASGKARDDPIKTITQLGKTAEFKLTAEGVLHSGYMKMTFNQNTSGNYCPYPFISAIKNIEISYKNKDVFKVEYKPWLQLWLSLQTEEEITEVLRLAGGATPAGSAGDITGFAPIPFYFDKVFGKGHDNFPLHIFSKDAGQITIKVEFEKYADCIEAGATVNVIKSINSLELITNLTNSTIEYLSRNMFLRFLKSAKKQKSTLILEKGTEDITKLENQDYENIKNGYTKKKVFDTYIKSDKVLAATSETEFDLDEYSGNRTIMFMYALLKSDVDTNNLYWANLPLTKITEHMIKKDTDYFETDLENDYDNYLHGNIDKTNNPLGKTYTIYHGKMSEIKEAFFNTRNSADTDFISGATKLVITNPNGECYLNFVGITEAEEIITKSKTLKYVIA